MNIILLAGPGGTAFGRKNVLLAEKALRAQEAHVIRIGDGENRLLSSDIDVLLQFIKRLQGYTTIVIMAHGDNEGCLNLTGEFATATFDLFKQITKSCDGRKIGIFSTACGGGRIGIRALDFLPEGSTYVSLSPLEKCHVAQGQYIDSFWAYLAEHNISCHSAELMLLAYVVHGLHGRLPPTIANKKTIHITIDTENLLNSYCKLKWSAQTRAHVYDVLSPIMDIKDMNAIIDKIEKAKNAHGIPVAEYGAAIAICHVGSYRTLLETGLTESKPPEFRKRKATQEFHWQPMVFDKPQEKLVSPKAFFQPPPETKTAMLSKIERIKASLEKFNLTEEEQGLYEKILLNDVNFKISEKEGFILEGASSLSFKPKNLLALGLRPGQWETEQVGSLNYFLYIRPWILCLEPAKNQQDRFTTRSDFA